MKGNRVPTEISIVQANYVDGFRVNLLFSDGTSQLIDLAGFLKSARNPVIKKYLKKNYFKQFQIVDGNLNWNDYELIFPIAELYRGSIMA